MNRDLTKYINSLPELGVRVWLHLFSESTPNGNSIVNYKELASEFTTTPELIKKTFLPDVAFKKGLIDIRTRTETLLVINFKTRGSSAKQNKNFSHAEIVQGTVPPQKKNKTIIPPNEIRKKVQKVKQNPLPEKKKKNDIHNTSIERKSTATNGNIIRHHGAAVTLISTNESDLSPTTNTISDFTFSMELQRRVIYEYCMFWKGLQASQQAASGLIGEQIKTFNPLVTAPDIKNLREISQYLYQNKFSSDDLIVAAFKSIYANWHFYREFVQTGTSTVMIKRNINEIVLTLQNLKYQTQNGNRKKEQELTKKLGRIAQKNYDHID